MGPNYPDRNVNQVEKRKNDSMFLQEKSGAFFKRKKFCCKLSFLRERSLSLNKYIFPNTCGWKTSPYAFCRVGVLNVFQCAPRCVRIIEIKITFTAALK